MGHRYMNFTHYTVLGDKLRPKNPHGKYKTISKRSANWTSFESFASQQEFPICNPEMINGRAEIGRDEVEIMKRFTDKTSFYLIKEAKEETMKDNLISDNEMMGFPANESLEAKEELVIEKGNRPTIKDYFGLNATLQTVHQTYVENPELFKYTQALDNYIDTLDDTHALLLSENTRLKEERDMIFKTCSDLGDNWGTLKEAFESLLFNTLGNQTAQALKETEEWRKRAGLESKG